MDVVTYQLRGTVAWVTMNRPGVMNASNVAMKDALCRAFVEAEKHAEARAVVLTGAGRAFCAGGDMKEAAALSREAYRARIRLQQELCLAIRSSAKPIVAAVNGPAVGGGLEMALMCDIRIAARSATLGTPATRIGSISTGALHRRLAQVIGEGHALHMLLTGDSLDADAAHRAGLVTVVCDDAALQDQAQALASAIGASPPAAVQALKRLFTQAQDSDLASTLDAEEQVAAAMWGRE